MLKAMKRIEDTTCIRFRNVKPQPGKPWLLLMREGSGSQCYIDYINRNLASKEIGNLGRVFGGFRGSCFGGAYARGLGAKSPAYMVTSMFDIDDVEGDIGLFVHEFLHNLGIGHSQKRPDRDNFITVNTNNINPSGLSQYSKCRGDECTTLGTPYDCSSIMHYRDYFFKKPGAGPTMTAKNPRTCSLSGYMTKLTNSDILLLKKMYCSDDKKECDSGWLYFEHTGKCYKSFDQQQTREDAIKGCRSANPSASLVSITDMKTNDFVLSKVSWRSWIGLEKRNGAWIWPDGTRDSLRNWIPGQPSGDGSFVEIVKDAWTGKPGQWNDLRSTWRRGSVCQYDLKGCNPGWTFFPHTGKCYRSIESRLSRAKAINACKASNPNANLAIISDIKTNDFLISMVKWRSWIGLEKRNGAWIWPDGTRDSLRNWIPGQPSGDGSFVEIVKDAWTGNPGHWNDLRSTWRRG